MQKKKKEKKIISNLNGANKVGILGYTGFLGARIVNDLKKKFEIKKIKKELFTNNKNCLETLICCAGPNKFWCLKNKNKIKNHTKKFSNKIEIYAKKNHVKNIIYLSTIHVLNNINNDLHPYVQWHKNMERNLLKSDFKILIIRLPNIFGKPVKIKPFFWDFFVNSIIKKSVTNKLLFVNNSPNKKIYAYPLNLLIEFLYQQIKIGFKNKVKIINLNKKFKFKTIQLLLLIQRIMKKEKTFLKFNFLNDKSKDHILKIKLNKIERKFFNQEIKNLISYGKYKINEK